MWNCFSLTKLNFSYEYGTVITKVNFSYGYVTVIIFGGRIFRP